MVRLIFFLTGSLLFLAGTVVTARNVRVVDYGADMGYGNLTYRSESVKLKIPYQTEMGGDARHTAGESFVAGWAYKPDVPLNPLGLRFDTFQKSALFYGGLMTLTIGNPERGPSEGHLNSNHEFRDDCNFMALNGRAFRQNEEIEASAFWFWKKENFLNGGDKQAVSFDAGSQIVAHISRYWGGVHAGRWIVREGEDFYVSEQTFASVYKQFTFEDKENPLTRTSHILKPVETRWAQWKPVGPFGFCFDYKRAQFEKRDFRNVSAVGFIVTRELVPAVKAVPGDLSPNQPIAVKWYAFRCDAVVGDGSFAYVPTVTVDKASNLAVSPQRVSFEQWEKIRRIAVTNQFPRGLGDLGYSFFCNGDMGRMRLGEEANILEDVTGITFFDALAWCNALSEAEGFEPAYYSDATFMNPLRRVFNRDEKDAPLPSVYWKEMALGYRLPTRGELVIVAKSIQITQCETLHPEYVWEDLADNGGKASSLTGSPLQGFRIVRGVQIHLLPKAKKGTALASTNEQKTEKGQPVLPDMATMKSCGLADSSDFCDPFEFRKIKRDIAKAANEKFLTGKKDDVTSEKAVKPERVAYDLLVGRSEISFLEWERVRVWALANGYRFNYQGDMGNMRDIALVGDAIVGAKFSPDEPVTFISWFDALAWCNALSEMNGLVPAYYTDADKKNPFRQVSPFRTETYAGDSYPVPTWEADKNPGKVATTLDTKLYFDGAATGYRLPTYDEFLLIATAQGKNKEKDWTGEVSQGRLRKTSALDAILGEGEISDIHGNVLEWAWDSDTSYMGFLVDYRVNGNGYYFEKSIELLPSAKAFHQEHPLCARTFIGLRVVRRK